MDGLKGEKHEERIVLIVLSQCFDGFAREQILNKKNTLIPATLSLSTTGKAFSTEEKTVTMIARPWHYYGSRINKNGYRINKNMEIMDIE